MFFSLDGDSCEQVSFGNVSANLLEFFFGLYFRHDDEGELVVDGIGHLYYSVFILLLFIISQGVS